MNVCIMYFSEFYQTRFVSLEFKTDALTSTLPGRMVCVWGGGGGKVVVINTHSGRCKESWCKVSRMF